MVCIYSPRTTTKGTPMTLADVRLPDSPTFTAAHVTEQRWNGFVRPFFNVNDGEEIIEWFDADAKDNRGEYRYGWDASADRFVTYLADENGEPSSTVYETWPTIEVDGETLHGIGVDAFTWELAADVAGE